MVLSADEIEELKCFSPGLSACEEGGVTFLLLPNFELPAGCAPSSMDILLCPSERDGYKSRLFFAERVQPSERPGRKALNWNGSVRIAERKWHAYSWQTRDGLRLAQMVATHLKALS